MTFLRLPQDLHRSSKMWSPQESWEINSFKSFEGRYRTSIRVLKHDNRSKLDDFGVPCVPVKLNPILGLSGSSTSLIQRYNKLLADEYCLSFYEVAFCDLPSSVVNEPNATLWHTYLTSPPCPVAKLTVFIRYGDGALTTAEQNASDIHNGHTPKRESNGVNLATLQAKDPREQDHSHVPDSYPVKVELIEWVASTALRMDVIPKFLNEGEADMARWGELGTRLDREDGYPFNQSAATPWDSFAYAGRYSAGRTNDYNDFDSAQHEKIKFGSFEDYGAQYATEIANQHSTKGLSLREIEKDIQRRRGWSSLKRSPMAKVCVLLHSIDGMPVVVPSEQDRAPVYAQYL